MTVCDDFHQRDLMGNSDVLSGLRLPPSGGDESLHETNGISTLEIFVPQNFPHKCNISKWFGRTKLNRFTIVFEDNQSIILKFHRDEGIFMMNNFFAHTHTTQSRKFRSFVLKYSGYFSVICVL